MNFFSSSKRSLSTSSPETSKSAHKRQKQSQAGEVVNVKVRVPASQQVEFFEALESGSLALRTPPSYRSLSSDRGRLRTLEPAQPHSARSRGQSAPGSLDTFTEELNQVTEEIEMEAAKKARDIQLHEIKDLLIECHSRFDKPTNERQWTNYINKLSYAEDNFRKAEMKLNLLSEAEPFYTKAGDAENNFTHLGYEEETSLQIAIMRKLDEMQEKVEETKVVDMTAKAKQEALALFSKVKVAKKDLEVGLKYSQNFDKLEKTAENISKFRSATVDSVLPRFNILIELVGQVMILDPYLQCLEGHTLQEWTSLHEKTMEEMMGQSGIWNTWLDAATRLEYKKDDKKSTTSTSNSLKLKKLEYPKFYGGIAFYARFIRDYRTLVVPNNEDSAQRAIILNTQCLYGDALKATSHMIEEDKILQELETRWGSKEDLVYKIQREIEEMKPCSQTNSQFVKFVDKLRNCYSELDQIGMTTDMSTLQMLQLITKKLPFRINEQLLEHEEYAAADIPQKMPILIEFLEDRRNLAHRLVKLRGDKDDNPKGTPPKKPLHLSAARADNSSNYHCPVRGCYEKRKHPIWRCGQYWNLPVAHRIGFIKKQKLCRLCLNSGCQTANPFNTNTRAMCKKGTKFTDCGVAGENGQRCGAIHHKSLHGSQQEEAHGLAMTAYEPESDVLLLTQRIELGKKNPCQALTVFDSGSTDTFITHRAARKSGAKSVPILFDVTGIQGKTETLSTRRYFMKVINDKGQKVEVKAVGLKSITADIAPMYLSPEQREVIQRAKIDNIGSGIIDPPNGTIDLLIGMDYNHLYPIHKAQVGKLALYQSRLQPIEHLILGGKLDDNNQHSNNKPNKNESSRRSTCLLASGNINFWSSEELGITPARACSNCQNCKDCSFISSQLSFQEQNEFEVISNNLKYDQKQERWVAKYPLTKSTDLIAGTKNGAMKMLGSLEKRLQKANLIEEYKGQIEDFINRGVITKMTTQQEKNQDHYFIPHNFVCKEGSSTTPVRLVTNSSYKGPHGYSLNDIVMKGPPSLNNLLHILLRFRGHKLGLVADLSKMYHSVLIHDDQKYLRRILWRDPDKWKYTFQESPPDTYNINTITFGDKPAGCIAMTALKRTAKMNSDIDPEAACVIQEDSYVDDVVTGAKDLGTIKAMMKSMEAIARPGGFKFKKFIVSGDLLEEQDILGGGLGEKVLGIKWCPRDDSFIFKAVVNPNKKKRGKKSGPDLTIENIYNLKAKDLTKRRLLRVVNSLFDPLGLLAPVTAMLKINMKLTKGFAWDQPLSKEIGEIWVNILTQLATIEVQFPRTINPHGYEVKKTTLVGFCDASIDAYAAVIYIVHESNDGDFQSTIFTAKNKVSPENKISIPRLELLSALLLSRLTKTAMTALTNMKIDKVYSLVDSTSTLGMINKQCAALQEFCGVRVGEIKRNTNEISQKTPYFWYWISRRNNVADIPSKGSMSNEILKSNYWQHGPEFLKTPQDTWPIKSGQDFVAPHEEVKINTCLSVKGRVKKDIFFQMSQRCSSLNKLLRVTAYILRLFKHKGAKKSLLDNEDIADAVKYWEENAMETSRKKLKNGDYKSLRGYLREDNYVVCAGRLPSQAMKLGYDKEELPILEPGHIYTKLFMKERHESLGHPGVDRIVDLCRNKYWIPNARKTAMSIWSRCLKCKIIDKRTQEQLMSKMQMWRTKPAPVFNTTCLDLFGPMYIKDNVIKRTGRGHVEGKCWGVVFTCAATGAVNIDITEDYSTDSMVQCLRRHMCDHGAPTTFITDRGTQLKAARDEVSPNWDLIQGKMVDIKWVFAPTAGHHYNGLAEAFVKRTKRTLETVLQGSGKMTFGKLQTFAKEVKQIINSRPLGSKSSGDPESAPPLTPNHLLLAGRSSIEIPEGPFQETKLNKRFIFVQNLVTQFWEKWMKTVFPKYIQSYKWTHEKRNLREGDVVLI